MRSLALLILISSVCWSQKVPVIDYDSPFNKTAILSDSLGQTEAREILVVEKKEGLLELRKADGTLIVVPLGRVVAIVPKLPNPSLKYTRNQAAKAFALLQKARNQIMGREEVSSLVMSTWEKLANQESNYEFESKKARSALIQNWFAKVTLDGDEEKNIPLEDYIKEGEAFLSQAGEDQPAMQARLEKARQRLAMDLAKVDKIQLQPDWAEVSLLLPLGLVGVLALVTIWGLLNVSNFLTALKMTMMSLLSQEKTSKVIILNTKSLGGIILGPILLYMTYCASRVEKKTPQEKEEISLSIVEKRAMYLSLNTHFYWSRQAAQKIEVPAENFLGYLFGKIIFTEPASSYVQFETPRYQLEAETLTLKQDIKVLWVPLQLKFCLPSGEGTFSFAKAKTTHFWLGKLPLGTFLGDYFAEGIFVAFKEWDNQLGIDSKAQWLWKDKRNLCISVPEVYPKNMEKTFSKQETKRNFHFKKQLSVAELVNAFAEGDGPEYLGRYVDLSGQVKEVISSHRLGNSQASELLRKTLANQGGSEAIARLAPKGIEDEPDIFYLFSEENPGISQIKVKCIVKAPETFFLDTHGDLYREGQTPGSDNPLVRKGMDAHFIGGRVESFERGVITLYDAKMSESGLVPDAESGSKSQNIKREN